MSTIRTIKARYFRQVISYPDGAVVHFGDCKLYVPGCLCTCGLHHDLMLLSDEEIREVYPKYREEWKKIERNNNSDVGVEQVVKIAVGIIMDSVIAVIALDGHQWSDRPCQTCRAVTGLIGKPFGCYWYQAKKKGKVK